MKFWQQEVKEENCFNKLSTNEKTIDFCKEALDKQDILKFPSNFSNKR
jgi:hypothetical protein